MSAIAGYIREKKIIVCCGAGGVGKTTTSAAIALAAARAGRRVLVLTIDPSKRLAETLGVERNLPEPRPLPEDRQRAAGIEAPGELSAWMLDPRLVSDRAVKKWVKDPADQERLLRNPVYHQVTAMVAGMQEYTAMEALHDFVESGRYDLVVLDTPPSRNALNFLEAPGRLSDFLDGRIFKLFLPSEGGIIAGTTSRLIGGVLGSIFGEEFYGKLQSFFGVFGGLFRRLGGNAIEMREGMKRPEARFLLVTSPAQLALEDAFFFQQKIEELELPFGGFVLNRSQATRTGLSFPERSLLPDDAGPAHRSAFEKLVRLAERERRLVDEHIGLLETLMERSGSAVPAMAVPEFAEGIDDLPGLTKVSDWLMRPTDDD